MIFILLILFIIKLKSNSQTTIEIRRSLPLSLLKWSLQDTTSLSFSSNDDALAFLHLIEMIQETERGRKEREGSGRERRERMTLGGGEEMEEERRGEKGEKG